MKDKKDVLRSHVVALSEEKVAELVEAHVKNDGLNHIEALMQVCEDYDLEPEDAGALVRGSLKKRLEVVARDRGFLPKTTTSRLEF